MSQPYVVSTAPRIGPRVLGQKGVPGSGQAAYAAELAKAQETGSGLIGKRILGNKTAAGVKVNPDAPPVLPPDQRPMSELSVVEAKSRALQPAADLEQLWKEEHSRTNGPRKTVVAALREAGYAG